MDSPSSEPERVVIGIAVLTGVLAVGGAPAVLRAPLALLLVLWLPGWALCRCVYGLDIRRPHGWVVEIGLSAAIATLLGFALHFVSGLTAIGWSIGLGGVTVALCLASLARADRRPAKGAAWLGPWPRWLESPLAPVFLTVPLVLVIAFAIGIYGALNRHPFAYSKLWIVPKTAAQERNLVIGIESREKAPETFLVELSVGGQLVESWTDVALKPGEAWTREFVIPGLGALPRADVRVYRQADPARLHLHVWTAERPDPVEAQLPPLSPLDPVGSLKSAQPGAVDRSQPGAAGSTRLEPVTSRPGTEKPKADDLMKP